MYSAKENAITAMEIAESNFLMVLKGIKPSDITKQVHPEVNIIAWIIGHLVSHMDVYLSVLQENDIFQKSKENILVIVRQNKQ